MDYGYAGKVVLVNPNLPPWDGVQVFPGHCRHRLPHRLVVVSLPRQGRAGGFATVRSQAFFERDRHYPGLCRCDEVGRRLQADITAIKDQAGIRILGPNTIGTANAFAPFTTSFLKCRLKKRPRA